MAGKKYYNKPYLMVFLFLFLAASCGNTKKEVSENHEAINRNQSKEQKDAVAGDIKSVPARTYHRDFYPAADMNWNCFMGGWTPGGWLMADSASAKLIKGDEIFKFYGFDGYLMESKARIIREEVPPCYDVTLFKFDTLPATDKPYIAVTCDWEPFIRKAEPAEPTQMVIDAVNAWLKENDIKAPKTKITQAYLIDIEGDGSNEMVLSAEHLTGEFFESPVPGEYSAVLIIKNYDTNPYVIPVMADLYAKPEEFGLKYENTITGLLDMNGDGAVEVIVSTRYYEGDATIVFEIQDGVAVQVMGCGCGA